MAESATSDSTYTNPTIAPPPLHHHNQRLCNPLLDTFVDKHRHCNDVCRWSRRGVLGQSCHGTWIFGSRGLALENVEFVNEGDGSSASRPSNLIVNGSVDLSLVLITTEAPDNDCPYDVAFDAAEVSYAEMWLIYGILIMLLTPQTPAWCDVLPKPRCRS